MDVHRRAKVEILMKSCYAQEQKPGGLQKLCPRRTDLCSLLLKRMGIPILGICAGSCSLYAQNGPATQVAFIQTAVTSPSPTSDENPAVTRLSSKTIPLVVAKGTSVLVMIDKEIKVEKVGQPIPGRVVVPLYAFDKLVVPVGTQANGRISKIEGVSLGKRTLAALNADFTPSHKIQVEFDKLILPDGKRISVQTNVTPGSGEVIQFVTASTDKKEDVKDAAEEKARRAKEQAKREWDDAMKQVHEPSKIHRLERNLIAQLPFHWQYIDPGTVYFADLLEPLDFGSEPLTAEIAASLGSIPPSGSVLHARLITPLSSATTQKGIQVEALISEPLFDGHKLIVPEGSLIKGSVVQVQPARGRKRNGQLRIAFHEFVPPDGIEQKVEANLEGVQATQPDHLRLDSESGVQATSPKTRYLMSGIAVGLAVVASSGDGDADVLNRTAGDTGGYKLLGIGMGLAIHSQPFGMAMGAFGASRSVYVRFISRGRDVEFPRDTAMQIGFGAPIAPPAYSLQKQ